MGVIQIKHKENIGHHQQGKNAKMEEHLLDLLSIMDSHDL